MLVTWGTGRSLLIRDSRATPGGEHLWLGSPSPGVSHVMVGQPDPRKHQIADAHVAARLLPHDELTRIPIWLASDHGLAETRIRF
jgi:hypothetical protein